MDQSDVVYNSPAGQIESVPSSHERVGRLGAEKAQRRFSGRSDTEQAGDADTSAIHCATVARDQILSCFLRSLGRGSGLHKTIELFVMLREEIIDRDTAFRPFPLHFLHDRMNGLV